MARAMDSTRKSRATAQGRTHRMDHQINFLLSEAIDICHSNCDSIKILEPWSRNRVAHYMDNMFHEDLSARKRFRPDQRSREQQESSLYPFSLTLFAH
eukprot:1324774-Amphidinium_carterae.2